MGLQKSSIVLPKKADVVLFFFFFFLQEADKSVDKETGFITLRCSFELLISANKISVFPYWRTLDTFFASLFWVCAFLGD